MHHTLLGNVSRTCTLVMQLLCDQHPHEQGATVFNIHVSLNVCSVVVDALSTTELSGDNQWFLST